MTLIGGLIMLLVGAGMMVIARPNSGGQYVIPFMTSWAVRQIYVLAVLVIVVLGVSFCLMTWPA